MSATNLMTPHEILELHEFLSAEVTAAQKMQVNLAAVSDNELSLFMRDAIAARQQRANRIQNIFSLLHIKEV